MLSLCALALGLVGCPRIDRSRPLVNRLRLHGVHQLPEDALRDHIATQEMTRVLGVRWPFGSPQYFDQTTYRRDLARLERIYAAHGYYSASVQAARVEPVPGSNEVNVDVVLREGPPTRVATVWVSGCEPPSRHDEPWPVSDSTCRRIHDEIQLHRGAVFSETAFDADRTHILDLLKDDGHATARVGAHGTVDPISRGAHIVFVLDPGPPSRFGRVDLYEGSDLAPVRGDHLPSGYPVGPTRRAIDIVPGQSYTHQDLVDAQRRLFDLGVFGIARIEEQPHRCDSRGRCDADADPDDPGQTVRVDLHVHLSGLRSMRTRYGGGVEIDQLRANVHGLVRYEELNLFHEMWRLRIDERPALYFPWIATNTPVQLGNDLVAELRSPELWRGGSLIAAAVWDLGPDPFTPAVASRTKESVSFGVDQHITRNIHAAAYIRATRVDFQYPLSPPIETPLLNDPIFRAIYNPPSFSQTYTYLEQQVSWDRRDSAVMPRSGTYISGLAQEAAPIPFVSDYGFLRGAIDMRGYIPLGHNFVIAARGYLGAIFGIGSGLQGWPVPQELRFFTGGPNSNRGYPFTRAGFLSTVPQQHCVIPGVSPPPNATSAQCAQGGRDLFLTRNDQGIAQADKSLLLAVGGLAAWEFSTELRWYLGTWGFVLFFDASDVYGWTPPAPSSIGMRPDPVPPNDPRVPNIPPAGYGNGTFDPHPSAGIGVRLVTPIGVARLDLGFRLDDLGCTRFNNEVSADNAANGGAPWYYVVSRPQCDIFGITIPIPIAINVALGEAF